MSAPFASVYTATPDRPHRTLVASTGMVQFNGLGSWRFQSRCGIAIYVATPPDETSADPAAPLAVEAEPGGEPEAWDAPGLPATTT